MTGKEAWDIIQDKINPLEHPEYNNAEMAEAFCLCYIAFKEYDKNHEPKKRCRDCKWLTGRYSVVGIECLNPQKYFRNKSTACFKYPHTPACKLYEEREN